MRRPLALLVSLFAVCFGASPARADELDGAWNAGALLVSWAIGDWGEACGPRPSGGGEAGGTVQLTRKGNELTITGLGRTYQTTQCWERMPGLTVQSHSASSSQLRTTCSMPPGDPRKAQVVTTWSLRGDTIYFDETGQYQFLTEGSNCTASARRTRLFTRVVPAQVEPAETPPKATEQQPSSATASLPTAVEPPLAPPRSEDCATVGAPERLEVTPRLKLMRAGETFGFRALARDARGCRVAVTPRWSITQGAELARLEPNGQLTVHADAPSGRVTMQVAVGARRLDVTADVVSQAEYERLLRGGGFGALGESEDAAIVTLTSSEVGWEGGPSKEDEPGGRRWILLALLGCAVGLGALALLLALRRRKRRLSSAPPPSDDEAPEVGPFDAPRVPAEWAPPAASPTTGTTAAGSPATTAPATATTAVSPATDATTAAGPGTAAAEHAAKVCPTCGTTYPVESTFCGRDGTRLLRSN